MLVCSRKDCCHTEVEMRRPRAENSREQLALCKELVLLVVTGSISAQIIDCVCPPWSPVMYESHFFFWVNFFFSHKVLFPRAGCNQAFPSHQDFTSSLKIDVTSPSGEKWADVRGNRAVIGSPRRILGEVEMRFVAFSMPRSQGRKWRGT